MELGQRIKHYRQKLHLSQDQLAESVFVTRQTISNWENEKNYPDIHSIIRLSHIFEVTIDSLIQGDLEKMEKEILYEDQLKMDRLSKQLLFLLILETVSVFPLFYYLEWIGVGIFLLIFVISLRMAYQIEKIKKDYDIQTYREIIAFSKGEHLDKLQKEREKAIRPYQKALIVATAALIAALICLTVIALMKLLGLF